MGTIVRGKITNIDIVEEVISAFMKDVGLVDSSEAFSLNARFPDWRLVRSNDENGAVAINASVHRGGVGLVITPFRTGWEVEKNARGIVMHTTTPDYVRLRLAENLRSACTAVGWLA